MQVRNDPAKWANRSAASSGEYRQGVNAPKRSWSASTVAAKDVYASEVNTAISEGRFEKGVQKAGDAKWKQGASELGANRYAQGVAVSAGKYQTGFAPFAAALQGLELGPRGPKGANYGRVQQVGEVLRAAKKTA